MTLKEKAYKLGVEHKEGGKEYDPSMFQTVNLRKAYAEGYNK